MTDNFCPKCGKQIRPVSHGFDNHGHHFQDHHRGHFHRNHHHDHFDHHHGHFNDHFDHHDFHRDDCICERFFCDDKFKVRLGGLTSSLNFRLRQLIGCKVKLRVDCGGECKVILAEICFVGRDFVEVNELEELDDDLLGDELNEEVEEDEAELEEGEEEQEEVEDCPKKKKEKKKKKKDKFAIFPMDSVKWFEVKDDCDCDCDCGHHDCDCGCH